MNTLRLHGMVSLAPLCSVAALLPPLRPLAAGPLQQRYSRWPLSRQSWARLASSPEGREGLSDNAESPPSAQFSDLLETDDAGPDLSATTLEGWTGLASTSDLERDHAAYSSGLRSAAQEILEPALYVVSTPIGNLEDMTLRALRVLRCADAILAEDTRHTRILLQRFGIRTPLVSYHAHNEKQRQRSVLDRLKAGAALAVVSDAGTPGVSDPGSLLVAAAAEAGVRVVPVPGPSALLAALVASGLATTSVLFAGFLPPKTTARKRRLAALGASASTVVFYVPPHKLVSTLEEAAEVIGRERRCCVARELTKVHEEFWRGSLGAAAEEFARPGRARGEVTLLIDGAAGAAEGEGEEEAAARIVAASSDGDGQALSVEEELTGLLAAGESPSHAARLVAEKRGVRRRDVYAVAQQLFAKQQPPAAGRT